MAPGFSDLFRMIKSAEIVFFLAWSDVRARYKRSVLGPLWMTLSTAIGVVGLGFIWSELFHIERKVYVPMLTVGLVFWQFFSASITEGTSVFVRQSSIIRNINLPLSFHPAQLIMRQLINLVHTAPLFILVVLFLGSPINTNMFYFFPALLLVTLNLFWMVLLVGTLGARYRDLEYLITMVMPLLMFFSPVMYRPNALPFSGKLMWFNPLAHMIEIVRQPLLGEVPALIPVAGNLALLIVGGGFTLWLFNKKCKRIALWV